MALKKIPLTELTCDICGTKRHPTPEFEFYRIRGSKFLYCENCYTRYTGGRLP